MPDRRRRRRRRRSRPDILRPRAVGNAVVSTSTKSRIEDRVPPPPSAIVVVVVVECSIRTNATAMAAVALSLGTLRYMGARLRGHDVGRRKGDPLRAELDGMRSALVSLRELEGGGGVGTAAVASSSPAPPVGGGRGAATAGAGGGADVTSTTMPRPDATMEAYRREAACSVLRRRA